MYFFSVNTEYEPNGFNSYLHFFVVFSGGTLSLPALDVK
jgi:hypothetical protein